MGVIYRIVRAREKKIIWSFQEVIRIQHPNMITILKKLKREGNFLSLIKASTKNFQLNGEIISAFLIKQMSVYNKTEIDSQIQKTHWWI